MTSADAPRSLARLLLSVDTGEAPHDSADMVTQLARIRGSTERNDHRHGPLQDAAAVLHAG